MSCPECDDGNNGLDWRWKAGVLCLVVGILLNYVHLAPESGMQKWLEFLDGLLLGLGACFLIAALMRMRKKNNSNE